MTGSMLFGAGRPLRFLALVLAGWTATRVVMLWPAEALPAAVPAMPAPIAAGFTVARLAVPPASARRPQAVRLALAPPRARVVLALTPHAAAVAGAASRGGAATIASSEAEIEAVDRLVVALLGLPMLDMPTTTAANDTGVETDSSSMTSGEPGAARAATPQARGGAMEMPRVNALSASGWLLARPGGGTAALASGGQLGGAQMGMRLAYRVAGSARPTALFARASSPLATAGRELSLGIEHQPFARVPVRLAAEHRFALERGAARGFALSAIGGTSIAMPAGFRFDTYGQAGFVGLSRRAGFVDGAAVATREVATLGGLQLRLGAGAWGGAQPGVARFDIGPRLEVAMPVAGRTLRLGVDWRQRIAGNAAPGSGPALTLGTDF